MFAHVCYPRRPTNAPHKACWGLGGLWACSNLLGGRAGCVANTMQEGTLRVRQGGGMGVLRRGNWQAGCKQWWSTDFFS
jgi:hypothetical protein